MQVACQNLTFFQPLYYIDFFEKPYSCRAPEVLNCKISRHHIEPHPGQPMYRRIGRINALFARVQLPLEPQMTCSETVRSPQMGLNSAQVAANTLFSPRSASYSRHQVQRIPALTTRSQQLESNCWFFSSVRGGSGCKVSAVSERCRKILQFVRNRWHFLR